MMGGSEYTDMGQKIADSARKVLGLGPAVPEGQFGDDDPSLVAYDAHKARKVNGKGAQPASEPAEPEGQAEPESIELPTIGMFLTESLERVQRRRDGTELPVPVMGKDFTEALGGGQWPGAHTRVGTTGAGKSQFEIQQALIDVKAGVPVLYVGLELDALQVALRVLGEHSGIPWSHLFNGRVSNDAMNRAYDAVPDLLGLPLHVDFRPADGWMISRLPRLLETMRKLYPSGPLLCVIDFLQLIERPEGMRGADLREHIGQCAYIASRLGSRYNAAINLVCSTARTSYAVLAQDIVDAGFIVERKDQIATPVRRVMNPEKFLAMAKESGNIEYACETVTTLVKWPKRLDTGETIVLAVAAKVRAGGARWAAFTFESGSFAPFPVESIEDLPELPKRKGRPATGAEPDDEESVENRVLETVRKNTNLRSASAVAGCTKGRRTKVLAAVKDMLTSGVLELGPQGIREADGGFPEALK